MVCTNASLEGLGEVLMQDCRVIAYESHKLKDHELNYPTHDLVSCCGSCFNEMEALFTRALV